jgi:hypothetical protein
MSHVDGLDKSDGLEETLGIPNGLEESNGLEEILGLLDGHFSLVSPPQAQHASLAITPALALLSAISPHASFQDCLCNPSNQSPGYHKIHCQYNSKGHAVYHSFWRWMEE